MAAYSVTINGHINIISLRRNPFLKDKIIGRIEEQKLLQKTFNSTRAEDYKYI